MMVLDTNVVSELMRPVPEPKVLAWIDRQNSEQLYLTSTIAAELLHGVARLPTGIRKRNMAKELALFLDQDFANRVFPFDLSSAHNYSELLSMRETIGKPMAALDAQIAAVCIQHGATLVTRNQKHFQDLGLELIDPWQAA
jgi:predicted nucleic acid-binding protein